MSEKDKKHLLNILPGDEAVFMFSWGSVVGVLARQSQRGCYSIKTNDGRLLHIGIGTWQVMDIKKRGEDATKIIQEHGYVNP